MVGGRWGCWGGGRKREGMEGPSPPVALVLAQTRALNHTGVELNRAEWKCGRERSTFARESVCVCGLCVIENKYTGICLLAVPCGRLPLPVDSLNASRRLKKFLISSPSSIIVHESGWLPCD